MASSSPTSAKAGTSTPERPARDRDAARRFERPLHGARLAVLLGGTSTEREVSVTSGRRMHEALVASPEGPEEARPAEVLAVPIDADGRWRVDGQRLSPPAALEALARIDVFVSALHGGAGENGEVQGLLAMAGKPCTGSGVLASALAMDKELTRRVVSQGGLRVARGLVGADVPALAEALATWEVAGWVVKPRCGGSSVGTSVVESASELPGALRLALDPGAGRDREALVEARVEGVEVAAGVLETPERGLEPLPLVEIRPRASRFFDYEEKYSAGGAIELCPPERVDAATCREVQRLALLAHRTLRCSGYSRTDFIVPADGGAPVFLELNTLPGMTPRSLLPQAAAVAGIEYRTLCRWIAAEALGRHER